MLVPSIFGRDMFDDFAGFGWGGFGMNNDILKTDVKDTPKGYEVTMDIPGAKKEDVKAELKDGYLTVSAEQNYENEDKDENAKFLRRERRYGSCSRSFYVGGDIRQEDIDAVFENGTLKLTIPKKETEKKIGNGFINIKGLE